MTLPVMQGARKAEDLIKLKRSDVSVELGLGV